MIDYFALAKRVHEANRRWWLDPETSEPIVLKMGSRCMLVISELSECMEAERKNLKDDKLPHRQGAEVEMADYIIRLLDMMGAPTDQLDRPPKKTAHCNMLIQQIQEGKHGQVNDFINDILSSEEKAEILMSMVKQVAAFCEHPFLNDIPFLIKIAEKYCEKYGYDLWGAFEEKMEYNATRLDHKIENRLMDGGKKW